MITMHWWWLLVWPAVAFGGTWWTGSYAYRRARRLNREHAIRIRLVDLSGNEWFNTTCEELNFIHRYGGQDEPPWQTLEVIRGAVSTVRLQVAPAHPGSK